MNSIMIAVLLLGTGGGGDAQAAEPQKIQAIQLPAPKTDKGVPLMQALRDRRSTRAFSGAALTEQQLSELLWAANGVNRADGKRTAPAALNVQAVDLYVVLPEGVYLFDAPKHRLEPVKAGDLRGATGRQEFVAAASVTLVFVLDPEKLKSLPEFARKLTLEEKTRWALISAGAQSQNAALYCASEGLGSVVRGSVDPKAVRESAGLPEDRIVLFAMTIGAPK
jgi:nitroreductase